MSRRNDFISKSAKIIALIQKMSSSKSKKVPSHEKVFLRAVLYQLNKRFQEVFALDNAKYDMSSKENIWIISKVKKVGEITDEVLEYVQRREKEIDKATTALDQNLAQIYSYFKDFSEKYKGNNRQRSQKIIAILDRIGIKPSDLAVATTDADQQDQGYDEDFIYSLANFRVDSEDEGGEAVYEYAYRYSTSPESLDQPDGEVGVAAAEAVNTSRDSGVSLTSNSSRLSRSPQFNATLSIWRARDSLSDHRAAPRPSISL
jgi:hypothetical protein